MCFEKNYGRSCVLNYMSFRALKLGPMSGAVPLLGRVPESCRTLCVKKQNVCPVVPVSLLDQPLVLYHWGSTLVALLNPNYLSKVPSQIPS